MAPPKFKIIINTNSDELIIVRKKHNATLTFCNTLHNGKPAMRLPLPVEKYK
jgi:hypothetical protein